MIRKLTSMSLAPVTALAVGAIMASGAMAADFHAAATSTTLTGSQTTKHVFTVGSGFSSISCTTATFSGTTSSTSTTQTELDLTPTYSGCSDTLGRQVHVSLSACVFRRHASGTSDIVFCLLGFIKVQITNSSKEVVCEIHIPDQNGINGESYSAGTGANGKSDITETTHATNVTSTVTNVKTLGCGVANGTYTSGTYDGTTTLEGSTNLSFG